MPKRRPFDEDARELANRLFATATAILEDVTEVAIAGQHPKLTAVTCARYSRELLNTAADIAALADTTLVISGGNASSRCKSDPQSRP